VILNQIIGEFVMKKNQSKWMSITAFVSVMVASLAMTGCNPNRSSNTNPGTTTSGSRQQPGSAASPSSMDDNTSQSGSDTSVMDQKSQDTSNHP
jgi:hypothetical protein